MIFITMRIDTLIIFLSINISIKLQ